MNDLLTVRPPSEAFAELAGRLHAVKGVDSVDTLDALGRIVAQAVTARETLPAFTRATMDGYAVRATDTFGASETSPAYLRLSGEVTMGNVATCSVESGTAVRVHTGAMLPPGANAVIMLEETNLRGDELEVLRSVAGGADTLAIGEDVAAGDLVVAAGHELRAQDLGALHALGCVRVSVRARPRIAILSTGDEVVSPSEQPAMGKVRDVNNATIGATIVRAGGLPLFAGIVADDEAALVARGREALAYCDGLVLSAGSSVSARDLTARALDRLGAPGTLVHGIALRPGKPTILGLCGEKPVVGLPGNPVSALIVAWRLVRPLVRLLAGAPVASDGLGDERAFEALLTESVPSRPGREDYVPAKLSRGPGGTLCATPVFGKSNLIFTLVRADGWIAIPFDRAGAASGTLVRVIVP
jgi:molybdopterin molybdotransferase